jgi:hypothetical protein
MAIRERQHYCTQRLESLLDCAANLLCMLQRAGRMKHHPFFLPPNVRRQSFDLLREHFRQVARQLDDARCLGRINRIVA